MSRPTRRARRPARTRGVEEADLPPWLLVAQSVLLAVLLTLPTLTRLTTAFVGSPYADSYKHVWTLWWMREELLRGDPGLHTSFVNFPAGLEFYPIEPTNAVGLVLPFSPVTVSNVLALAHVTLVGVCTGLLGARVSGRTAGGLAAGALAQACAFVSFSLAVGVGELRQVWWIPLGLYCAARARESAEGRWFAATAACVAGATLSCFYHGFFLGTGVVVYALATLRPDPRLLLGWTAAGIVALLVVVPALRAFSGTYTALVPGATGLPVEHMAERLEVAQMDLRHLFFSRAAERATSDASALAYTGGRYLGGGVVLLALLGVAGAGRRAAPWFVVGLTGLVFSLGTELWWNGQITEPHVTLPFTWLNVALAEVAEPMNFPVRFVVLAMIGFAATASFAAARWPWLLLTVPLVAADQIYSDVVAWPREMSTLADTTGLVAPEGAIADVTGIVNGYLQEAPSGSEYAVLRHIDPGTRQRSIAVQIHTGRPVQTVPLERWDRWAFDGAVWVAQLPLARALAGRSVAADDLNASLWLLRQRGFGSLLVTHDCDRALHGPTRALLEKLAGPPLETPCLALWTIPEVPTEDGDPERWTAEHVARLGTGGL